MSIDIYRDRYLPLLEAELRGALPVQGFLSPYYGMMQYHMGWLDADFGPIQASGGKRLRPLLCLLACEAAGGQIEHALPAAAAIELLHNFTLIHDDIEDHSATRRHRTTVWKLWGIEHGVNCGDGMFAAALLRLSRLHDRGVPPEQALEAQRALVETCLRLTEGQYMDMTFETQMDVDIDSYLWMIGRKTAALIACSTRLGALLGGASGDVIAAYARFGENLGLAFQVIDDILGIWGREADTGKSASSDILTRKKTLPVVYALHDPELRAIYAQESLADGEVERVLSILGKHQAREFAAQMAREYSQQAIDALDEASQSTSAHKVMRGYAMALLKRSS
jgi:geranylgeranyl diphosphate synthase type I